MAAGVQAELAGRPRPTGQEINAGPLYPWALNLRDACPKGDECPGWRYFQGRRGRVLFYCHDRMCPELWPGMLTDCPCSRAYECKGNHWDKGTQVCNLREGKRLEVE